MTISVSFGFRKYAMPFAMWWARPLCAGDHELRFQLWRFVAGIKTDRIY